MQRNFGTTLRNNKGFATRLLDVFIIVNLAFLALDVFIAHAINGYAYTVEWLPVYFSLVASVLFTGVVAINNPRWLYGCRTCVGWSAICVGITGMLLHLNSHFFTEMSLKNLVYAAPFVAPLAYTGIGMLLLLNNQISDTDLTWAKWVVLLAVCGWCGNFILSAFDHAQNGFFNVAEWLPVITSAMAIGCLGVLLCVPYQQRFVKFCVGVLCINIIIGIAGFFFHLAAGLQTPAIRHTEKFLYGAPLFAPLLFPNLSILALLGISKLSTKAIQRSSDIGV